MEFPAIPDPVDPGESASMPLADQALLAALRRVDDPEVGISIVDLGLVCGIDRRPEEIVVRLTMTSPACPLSSVIEDEIRQALVPLVDAGTQVRIELVYDPPWEPSRMSASAKAALGW